VEERQIGGRRATNRAGAAEILGRSLVTVNHLASPKGRIDGSGFPTATVQDGREWYFVDDLDRYRERHLAHLEAARLPQSHGVVLDGDPDDEITAVEFRKAIGVEPNSWTNYVDKSKAAWDHGEDGYLPRPDREEPAARRGVTRFWTRRRAQAWIATTPAGDQPPT